MARKKKIEADVVSANCFVLKNPRSGEMMARLSAAFGSFPQFEMFDNKGNVRITMSYTSPYGPRIELRDDGGEIRALLQIDDVNGRGEPELVLYGDDGSEATFSPRVGLEEIISARESI